MGSTRIVLASCTYATIMYLFPRLDVTGKRPVWSVAILPVRSIHFTFTKFVRN